MMSSEQVEKWIIRTSDRGQFKKCRQFWDFKSPLRMYYEYAPGIQALDFGTAVHAGLEVYYEPETWGWVLNPEMRGTVEALTLQAFVSKCEEQVLRIKKNDQWTEQQNDRFIDDLVLGKAMLQHYFMWAPQADRTYKPVRSEIEFEVPVIVPKDMVQHLPYGFDAVQEEFNGRDEWCLYYLNIPVVYQGRIDAIFEDENGNYWIVDHKTAKSFGQQDHLNLDSQCSSYMWALWKMLNLQTQGVIYSELRKSAPKDPEVLKSGGLSKNKNISTSAHWYLKALKEGGHHIPNYRDFLKYLKETDSKQFFRRTTIFRSQVEMARVERNICVEAIDMLNSPTIYTNPSPWNCNGCQFFRACLAREDGSDWQWMLDHSGLYIKGRA
jgi:hypothetical protein